MNIGCFIERLYACQHVPKGRANLHSATMNECTEQVKEREEKARRRHHRKSSKKNIYIYSRWAQINIWAVCRYFAAALLGATLDPIYSAIILVLSLLLACALLLRCTPTTQLLFSAHIYPFAKWTVYCMVNDDECAAYLLINITIFMCDEPTWLLHFAHYQYLHGFVRIQVARQGESARKKKSVTKYGNEKKRSPMWAFVPGNYVLLWDHVRRQKKAAIEYFSHIFFSLSCCFANTKFYCYCENGCRGCRYRTEWYHARW